MAQRESYIAVALTRAKEPPTRLAFAVFIAGAATILTRDFDILMDMQMPVMEGVAATRAIRTGNGPNATAPILALTANAMREHKELWRSAGVEVFQTKPLNVALLLEAMTAAVSPAADETRAPVSPVEATAFGA